MKHGELGGNLLDSVSGQFGTAITVANMEESGIVYMGRTYMCIAGP